MKTPREILFHRHQAAEAKLDALRRDVLRDLPGNQDSRPNDSRSFLATCCELFRLPRWAWTGLAAAWLLIIGLNIAARDTTDRPASSSSLTAKGSSDTLQALREQKQLFAELVGLRSENPDAETPRFVPRPRSELAAATACV